MTVRPTMRCLNDDLGLKLPPVNIPLNEIDHPLIKKSNDQFGEPAGARERISSVDDVIWFKVKVQRWRGAVVEQCEPRWLVAAGTRESGSPDDFYEALATSARAARARHNALGSQPVKTDTYCRAWLPTIDDADRYRAESGIRLLWELRITVHGLLGCSLLDSYEHSAAVSGAEIGVQVKGDPERETYVALRTIGSVPESFVAVLLDLVPGCDRDGWYPEFVMPDRPLKSGEQAYSNFMDPAAAAKLLQDRDAR